MSWLPAEPQHQSASGKFDEFQSIDHFQDCARLLPDILAAAEVAWVVVGDAPFEATLSVFRAGWTSGIRSHPEPWS